MQSTLNNPAYTPKYGGNPERYCALEDRAPGHCGDPTKWANVICFAKGQQGDDDRK